MFLFLALFTVTPNLGGTFRLGKNPTSLTLIKDNFIESEIILFLLSTLKEHISLHVYKYWFAPENLLWVGALRLNINYPEFRRYHHTMSFEWSFRFFVVFLVNKETVVNQFWHFIAAYELFVLFFSYFNRVGH